MSYQLNAHTISYRPDIDGLRALAILPVVLFHAFPNLLPGGFIGVDIFFVISGYLITSILLKDIHSGTYSIKHFYARRVRRIFPALIVVLLFCIAMGWLILTPEEYQKLGKHTAGGVGFIANFMLWKESGYFDAAADTKPLLHLWSLGIEEQFYIVWPILLYFAHKIRVKFLLIIILVGLISFGLNIWHIQSDPTRTFYSPFTRSWELALGAFLAYQANNPISYLDRLMQSQKSTFSLLGLGAIVLGFVIIDESRSFPGWWALLPAVGSALLISSGSKALVNRVILSNRAIVWVGLISFPLYLWHWPLLSFARIIYSETPPVDIRLILILVSVGMAWLTFRFIEVPVRKVGVNSRYILLLVFTLLVVGLAGHLVNKSKGVPARQFGLLNADPQSLSMGADRSRLINQCGLEKEYIKNFQTCWTDPKGNPRLAVLGDSKGEAIFYGLARESDANASWMMIGNMTPIKSVSSRFDAKNTLRTNLALDALAKNKTVEVVLLGVALRSIFAVQEVYSEESMTNSPYYESSLAGLSDTVDFLERSGKKVVFYMDHPGFPDPKSCISGGMTSSDFLNQFFFRKVNPRCSVTYEQYQSNAKRYYEFVKDLSQLHPQMYVYDPAHLVCDVANNRCEISKNGKFLYSYGDHLSDFANSMIARDFLPKISHLLKK